MSSSRNVISCLRSLNSPYGPMKRSVQIRPIEDAQARGVGRREILARMAVLFGAGALVTDPLSGQGAPTDVSLLNYALTIENLESAFYTEGLATFSSTDFANSTFAQNIGTVIRGDVYAYLCLIRDQEAQHTRMLRSLIANRRSSPVNPCIYNFTFKTADDFVTLAVLLENIGIAAYNGALYQIQDLSLRRQMATIATVEARHSAYLNLLTGTSVSPSPFDNAATSATVLPALAKYSSAC